MIKNNKSRLSIYYFALIILMIGLIPITKTVGYQNAQCNSLLGKELETNNEITRGGSTIFANGSYVYLLEQYTGFEIYDVSIKDQPIVVDSFKYSTDLTGDYSNMIVQNDYIYFFSQDINRFTILDCSNVTDVKLKGNFTLPAGHYQEFAVLGWNLYAITGTEFSIFNFTGYSDISLLDSYTNASASFSDITIKGNYSYILDSGYGLAIFNVTDSTDIQKANELVIDDSSTFRGFFVTDDYLYIQEGYTTLHIYNITDHLAITYITNHTVASNHFNDLLIEGNYVFALFFDSFDIIDISNLADIQTIGNYQCEYVAIFEDISVDGNYAYMTSTQSGELQGRRPLYIVDITNLESPVHIYPEKPYRMLNLFFIIVGSILVTVFLISVIAITIVLTRKKNVQIKAEGKN